MEGEKQKKKNDKNKADRVCSYFCSPDVHHGEPSIYHGNQHTAERDTEGRITLDMTQNKG